ncbi:helix-turn-helix transcriptional regulator [Mesobacillus subterraneus]|uniref:helix-turn-helix domain-containing protein n=1 Tax=Mesobacillus subterraneus TaxID=285983 RepID=UPI00203F0528|nr:helix-turn-helix domain-containing protein [Mesobacillus subterraneus]MCM3574729.1 helix-turn-helix transcriptional regulator [Mesobacillus subterraneus]
MDFSIIGKEIKFLRKSLGLSQKELSKDICTQAQISKIENGEVYPLASTLYLIAKRLGVDINYFFDVSSTPNLTYVNEVSAMLLHLRTKREFEEIWRIVKHEKKNPIFNNIPKNKQLLLWYEGICQYELKGDKKAAIETLKKAIDISQLNDKVYNEREIEILNSIAVIHYDNEEFEKVIILSEESLNHLAKIPFLIDATIKTRIYYNLSKSYTRLGNYYKSLEVCRKGIDWCISSNTLSLFAELHYQIGYNYELLEENEKAVFYIENSLNVFLLQKDEKYKKHIQRKLELLRNNPLDNKNELS